MHIIACESNDSAEEWKKNVSDLGWLRTVRGITRAWTRKDYVDE